MTSPSNRRRALALCGAVLALPLLAGCDSGGSTGTASLTLADTKASAQLLRNNALDRITEDYVDHVSERKDISLACGDPADDPDELMRSWYSTALVGIVPAKMGETDEIMRVLAESLEPNGWEPEGDSEKVVLTKPSSTSKITLTVVPITSQLLIESEGPCVLTDGPDSDEVRSLESTAER